MKKYILILLIPFLALTFTGGPSGWYEQTLPVLPNMQVSDVFFLDSLNGWIVTGNGEPNDTSGYILKTTNGGDNWNLKFTDFRDFSKINFLNENTGYVSGGYGTGARIYKSTNGGDNWSSLGTPGGGQIYFNDMNVLNEDTLWVVTNNSFVGGVFRTTNGGVNWTQQLNLGSQNPNRIYMINGSTGFIADDFNYLRRTTNSGTNWNLVSGTDGFLDMHFIDDLTGWKAYGFMKKTTDGGNTWVTQPLQTGGQLITSNMGRFSVLNKDTIWGVGGQIFYGGSQTRGVLWRTTNGGNNWAYQAPDTAFGFFNYYFIHFADHQRGWAYTVSKGIRTISGGDTIFTSVKQISSTIPSDHKLFQNYPNPFNPTTKIRYDIHKSADVGLSVYDMSGKEVIKLVNERQGAGSYEVGFPGIGISSGVYFYVLRIDSRVLGTKKMVLVK